MRTCGRRREDTTIAYHLTRKCNGIRRVDPGNDVRESALEVVERRLEGAQVQTIVVDRSRRGLAGDLRDVVAETDVRRRKVILNQLALFQQRAVEIGRGRGRAEDVGKVFVL